MNLRFIVVAAALAAAALAWQSPAAAQSAPVYPFCLQQSDGPRDGGGGGTLCRYQTLAQCWASKTGPSDFCYPNPAYPAPRKK